VDPERSHLVSIQCIISGRGERQGAYTCQVIFPNKRKQICKKSAYRQSFRIVTKVSSPHITLAVLEYFKLHHEMHLSPSRPRLGLLPMILLMTTWHARSPSSNLLRPLHMQMPVI
jgi:hypothetical protein